MNTETGDIYRGAEAIQAALGRGEPVVRISERVASLMTAGKRQEAKTKQKRKRKQEKQDRKRTKRGK